MERLEATAPPVVAVMVIHRPDALLDEALAALASQDYPDMRTLLLVTEGDASLLDVRERATRLCPRAVVRSLGGNPGWGAACNTALDLVEGDRGFFLLLHDDVAMASDAVSRLVEELYRSNAGIVGPKLLEWDDPRRLHRVGLGVDRIGEIDPLVEPGELDQEQHDAVRDMFALPSACLLVRADLLRLLRFDETIDFHGDDVDLCWRAHLTGARVLLVPSASARHRGRLPERRPDLDHRAAMARHRAWSVATLTGARRLPAVVLRLVVVTLAELAAGVVTRRARESWSMLLAVAGLVPRLPRVVARRRRIRPLRQVPENEVAYLQMRGSARLQRYRRARQVATEQRGRRHDTVNLATLGLAALFVLVGSRRLVLDGVAPVGEMLPFPASPRSLLEAFTSSWWGQGLGGNEAAPTAWALVGLGGAAVGARMALLHTLTTVGLLGVGLAGLWRVGVRLGAQAGRRACLLGGVVVPFAVGALATGRWSALLLWAATPWWVDAVTAASDEPSGLQRRRLASMVLSVALVGAFVPAAVVLVPVLGLVLGMGTLMGHAQGFRAGLRSAWRGWWLAIVGALGAAVVHLPWSWTFLSDEGWTRLMGPGEANLGWWQLVQWGRSGTALAALSALVLVPTVAVGLLTRGHWSVWGQRSVALVGGFGLVVVLIDRRMVTWELGDVWWWMAPASVGAALAVGTLAAAWRDDVVTRTVGWRQPLGLVSALTVVVAALSPAVGAVDGRWDQPGTSLSVLLQQLPSDDDHRVVFVGDQRVLPLRSRVMADGVGVAVVDDGPLTATTAQVVPTPNAAVRAVSAAFEAMAQDSTPRLGRLLAPLGIRFIVVPIIDGVASTPDEPIPVPTGLLERLGSQLDLRRRSGTSELVIFENTAWIPTRALLRGAAAEASEQAGQDALVEADLTDHLAMPAGSDTWTIPDTASSVMHLGVPRAAGWSLEVNGVEVTPRTSFGMVTAWDLPDAPQTTIELVAPSDPLRWAALALQGVVWTLLAVVASGVRRRRRSVS